MVFLVWYELGSGILVFRFRLSCKRTRSQCAPSITHLFGVFGIGDAPQLVAELPLENDLPSIAQAVAAVEPVAVAASVALSPPPLTQALALALCSITP